MGTGPIMRSRGVRPWFGALILSLGCVARTVPAAGLLEPLGPRLTQASVERRAPDQATSPEVRRQLRAPLEASDAIDIALRNSPRLQASFAELDVALADLRGARRVRNPDAEVSALFAVDGDEEPVLEFSLLVDLSDMARVGLRARVADAAYQRARAMAAGEAMDLAYETRLAFLELLAAIERVRLLTEVVTVFRAGWESAAAMREAGNVPVLDVVQQRGLYEESRVMLAGAELAVLDRREILHALMGLVGPDTGWQVGAELELVPDAEVVDETDLETRALDRSLELAALRHSIEGLSRQVGLERTRGGLPALHAGVVAERSGSEWEVGPVVELELPLFDQNQGGIGRAQAMLAVASHRYVDLAVRVRSMARRARNRLVVSRQQATFLRETLVPVRQQVVEQALLQYNAMDLGVFDLLRAKRQHVEALLAELDARLAYWRARAALEQVLAGRMTEMGAAPASMAMPSGGDGGGH